MKKVNLYELFGHLDSKDVLLTDIKSDSVNCDKEKIRNMTLKKVHQNMKQQKQVRFLRTMKRMAAGFVLAAILGGGAYAVASEELGWSIKKMFGLNEKEVLTSDQKISTDDYSLSLVDMAYDGNIGRILIKLEALTKEAEKELKQLPGPVASKAASMCYYTDLSNEKEAYYWLDINGEQENIRINIPKSTQYLTVSLKKTIEPKSISLGKSEMYTKLEYSPLGITIWAEGDTDTNFPEDPGDVQITFRYKNGKEDVLTGKSSTEKKVGINHSSREAVQDDSFEGFRWIYGFSNRCDWTQIDAVGIDGVWYPL